MNKEIILYGASGHCKVVLDIAKLTNNKVVYIIDDNKTIKKIADISVRQNTRGRFNDKKYNMIISIGNNSTRKSIADLLNNVNFQKLIHPSSSIDITSIILEGTVVMAGVIVNSSVSIGRHCIINTGAIIDHDCFIGDFVHISPNATLCGDVSIGNGTQVGAGTVIIQGVRIGNNVKVGAGTVVIKDVPDNVTIVGNPGRIIKEKK